MNWLNTPEYLSMRRQAFSNDGVTPDPSNAPDLFLWDTTKYTNFKQLLIGGTAHMTDAQLSLSGGSKEIQFLIGASIHRRNHGFSRRPFR